MPICISISNKKCINSEEIKAHHIIPSSSSESSASVCTSSNSSSSSDMEEDVAVSHSKKGRQRGTFTERKHDKKKRFINITNYFSDTFNAKCWIWRTKAWVLGGTLGNRSGNSEFVFVLSGVSG